MYKLIETRKPRAVYRAENKELIERMKKIFESNYADRSYEIEEERVL